ncbi:MAG TPA: holin [Actinomycetota bacterium]|nr:holin [Actinomycetota bacterium]
MRATLWTKAFWKAAAERAIKTFAQTVVTLVGVDQLGAEDLAHIHTTFVQDLELGAISAALSVLTSIISSGIGNQGPSLTTETITPAAAGE